MEPRPRSLTWPVRAAILGSVLLGAALLLAPWLRTEWALREARAALQNRDAEQALVCLQRARKLDPDRGEVYFLLARAHRRLGRMADVRRYLIRARDAGWPAEEIRREEWLALAQSGQMSLAEPHLGELLRDQRDEGPLICEAFVEGYFATYRFDQAMPILEAWTTDFPQDPLPHTYVGAYREHLQDWTGARASYENALRLSPADAGVQARLASVLLELHEYDQAAALLEKCIGSHPQDSELLCLWAVCLQGQARLDEARDVLERILAAEQQPMCARLAMGQLEQFDGNSEAALRWLEPLGNERPTDREVRYLLAQVLQTAGRGEEARGHFDFVADSQRSLQEVNAMLPEVREAPDSAALRYEIGVRLLKYADPAVGVFWLTSALDIDPTHQPAHAALAEHYAALGQADLAAVHRNALTAGATTTGASP